MENGITIHKCKCGNFPTLYDNSNIVKVNSVWWVECPACKVKGESVSSFWQAVNNWNRRVK